MHITLYKNCILNNKYQNVFSTKTLTGHSETILEEYLNTLTKINFSLSNTYYDGDSTIVVDYDYISSQFPFTISNIYEFNYMRVIDDLENSSLMRYCFIDNIKLQNGCVYITYYEDIYSSFFNAIQNTQTCNLIASRLCTYGQKSLDYRKLPLQFDGNNILYVKKIGTNTKCKIACELQTYLMDGEIVTNSRESHLCIIELSTFDETLQRSIWRKSFTKQEIPYAIKSLLAYVGSENKTISSAPFGSGAYRGEYYYEIGNIYLLPDTFDISNLYVSCLPSQDTETANVDFTKASFSMISQTLTNPPKVLFDELKPEYRNSLNLIHGDYIENDFSLISVGTFGTQIPIEPNGTDIDYSFSLSYDEMNISIQFNCANKIIDVSKDFLYVQHYNLVTSDVTIQRKIELAITSLNYDKNILSLQDKEMGYVFNSIKNLTNGSSSIASENSASVINNALGLAENAGHALFTEMIRDKTSLQQAKFNQPHYSNTKGNFITSNSFLSYFSPIYEMHIDADNKNYIKDTINTLGYTVFEYTNTNNGVDFNSLFDCDNAYNLGAHYDYLKFSFPNVYGAFTNEIARKLNKILESGIKIWYDKTLTEDNYHKDVI